jgi:hypothetical protein
MLVTIDLPPLLLHQATACANAQRCSLQDIVIDALKDKLPSPPDAEAPPPVDEWAAFQSRLQLQPDGSVINPDGLDDDHEFFKNLERIRSGRWD